MSSRPASVELVASGLSAFSRFEDASAGRSETQSFLSTPAGPLFSTMVEPLGRPERDVGVLFCHSFAWEQYELYPLELSAARRVASAGFAAMTFQARGYNDSGGEFADVTPATHVRDVLAAAKALKVSAGVEAVVPVGASFGSAVALLAAIEMQAPGVALWNPVQPAAFLDGLLRASTVAGMLEDADMSTASADGSSGAGAGASAAAPRRGFQALKAALENGETLDVFGFPVTPAMYGECREIDVLACVAAGSVPARALEVIVNPASRRTADAVGSALSAQGAQVLVEQAEGPGRREFAASVPRGGHLATHAALFDDVIAKTLTWLETIS